MASVPLIFQSYTDREIAHLHPKMQPIARDLLEYLARAYQTGLTKFEFQLFEGFRHPARQHHLLTNTNSTKAGPWQSSHQFGLAIDLVCWQWRSPSGIRRGWTWHIPDEGHLWLKETCETHGLVRPLDWDKGHFEHPYINAVKAVLR